MSTIPLLFAEAVLNAHYSDFIGEFISRLCLKLEVVVRLFYHSVHRIPKMCCLQSECFGAYILEFKN